MLVLTRKLNEGWVVDDHGRKATLLGDDRLTVASLVD